MIKVILFFLLVPLLVFTSYPELTDDDKRKKLTSQTCASTGGRCEVTKKIDKGLVARMFVGAGIALFKIYRREKEIS